MSLWTHPRPCGDCGAAPGELHGPGCDVERCPACGGQSISCGCGARARRGLRRVPWSGIWPGIAECRKYGLYARMIPGQTGWHPCGPDDPGAHEDLTTLVIEGLWNRETQRFEIPR